MTPSSLPSIEGYEVLDLLGQGGMGAVFRARQVALQRVVALKVLDPSQSRSVDTHRRFRREMQIHLGISHPHVVTVFDVDTSRGIPYIAMELEEGGTLASRLRDDGAMGAREAVQMLGPLAEALSFLHARGILHRDLKPANVLISSTGAGRLSDFGLARCETQTVLTGDETLLGTIPYLAPEVFEGSTMGTASDIYALGLIGYEMLRGQPFFALKKGSAGYEMVAAIQRGEIPPISFLGVEGIPLALEDLLLEMVARDPAHRPEARDVVAALEEIEAELSALGETPAPPPPARRGPRLFPPSRGHGFGAVALVLGLAGAGATFNARLTTPPAPASVTPVSVPSPHPSDETLVTRIRQLAAEALALLDRYDSSAPPEGEMNTNAGLVTSGILKDGFHRRSPGDLSLLFTAVNRLLEAVRVGDEAGLDHPVWMDLERIGYEVVQEAGSSHGFDTGNVLRSPLLKLEEEIAAGDDRPFRRLFTHSLLPLMVHLEGLSAQTRKNRLESQRQLFKDLEAFRADWRDSPRGKLARLLVLLRIESDIRRDTWLAEHELQQQSSAEIEQVHRQAFQFMRDNLKEGPDSPDAEASLWTRWCMFYVMADILPHLSDGSRELEDVLRLLERTAGPLEFERLTPLPLFTALHSVSKVLAEAKRRPGITLPTGLTNRWRRLIESHPEIEAEGRVTVRQSRRPPTPGP